MKTKKSLIKLNGEYVKFYTTSNEMLPELYKNSGALVVYSDLNENRNYIYLGGELLASGYGVNSIETRNKLETVASYYDATVSYLNNKIDKNTAYCGYIYKYFKENSLYNGSDISSTYISINNKNINIVDFLSNTVNAKYKELEILNKENELTYNINNTNYTIKFTDNENISLPVGASIVNVLTKINIKYNDTGGVSKIDASFFKTTSTLENNKLKVERINNVDSNGNLVLPKTYNEDIENTSKEIILKYVYNNINKYYINPDENILIGDINLDSHKTIKFKPYMTKELINDDTNEYKDIYSIENIIEPKNYKLNNVKVNGDYCLLYLCLNNSNNLNTELNNFSNNAIRQKLENTNILNIPSNTNRILLAIPTTYNIIDVFSKINYKYNNWTGHVNESELNNSNINYIKLYNITNLNLKYNLYYIDYDIKQNNIIGNNINLIINIEHNNKNLQYNIDNLYSNEICNDTYYKPLQNEEFNSLYWFDNNVINSLNLKFKFYVTNDINFINNPLSYENQFKDLNILDDFTKNQYSFDTDGKLYIFIPKYYEDTFKIKINNIYKKLSKKLIKYNNCDYIIIYIDGESLRNNTTVYIEKVYKTYIGTDAKNIINYNKYFNTFNAIDINNFYDTQININKENENKYLYLIFPEDWYTTNFKLVTYNNVVNNIKSNDYILIDSYIYNKFKIYDTNYIIISTLIPLENNTPIFIIK